MAVIISHRRPFFGKLNTSILKRRYPFERWLAHVRGRGGAPMACRYLGAAFLVSPGELIGDEIAINRYEWRELAMMIAACRQHRPEIFIDAGANVGVYSCIIGKTGMVPRVIAFEPDRRNFTGLVDNIRRNGLAGVVDARPCAVGAEAGIASLVSSGNENTGLSKIAPSHPDAYPVPVAALDDEVELAGRAIVMKMDVEGYELEALRGAARLLRSNYGYAQIEALGDARAAEVAAIMRGHGWHFVDRHGLDSRFERILVARH